MDEIKKMVELDGADIFSDWDRLVNNKESVSHTTTETEFSLDNLMTDSGDDYWLKLFQQTNLTGMDLVALNVAPEYTPDFKFEWTQLKNQSKAFLCHLPQMHLNDLRIAGLSEDQIEAMKTGVLPINWTVHLKYPVAYGGTITLDNFVLIPHQPFHDELHRFIDQQIVTDAGIIQPKTLYVPVPRTKVYVPFGNNQMATEITHFKRMGGQE